VRNWIVAKFARAVHTILIVAQTKLKFFESTSF